MAIVVPKCSYRVINKRKIVLKSEFLGSGIGIGVMDKKNEVGGLLHYIFPTKSFDIVKEEINLLSGESLLPLFFKELKNFQCDFSEARVVIAGGSNFKNEPEFLNIGKRNLEVALKFVKNLIPDNNILVKTGFSLPVFLMVDLQEKKFRIKIGYREEEL